MNGKADEIVTIFKNRQKERPEEISALKKIAK